MDERNSTEQAAGSTVSISTGVLRRIDILLSLIYFSDKMHPMLPLIVKGSDDPGQQKELSSYNLQ
ncbi:MAG: hypothetical protein M5U34_06145 [Chloroflexi bacterium]|nr:hypothetical protein [Chloroflexota bacterium]